MSLSELFKPRLRSCGACAAPWPNVALVLQYLQALRVSSDTFKLKKNKKNLKKEILRLFWIFRVETPIAGCGTMTGGPTTDAPGAESVVNYLIKIFESNLGSNHLLVRYLM